MIVLTAAVLLAAAPPTPPAPAHLTVARPYLTAPAGVEGVLALTATGDWTRSIRGARTAILSDFPLAGDAAVVLDLQRRDVLGANATLRANELDALARPGVAMFGGHVAGDHDSLAYLAFSDHFTLGYIRTQGQQYIVSSGPAGQGGAVVVYNLAELPDGLLNAIPFECDALDVPARPRTGSAQGSALRGTPPCRVAHVAIETDSEFRTNLFGGNAAAAADYATALVGANSEIYQRDLNIRFNITFLRIWTTPDPWNAEDALAQLFQFQDYWNANMAAESRSSVHYFSGRPLGGGVAYVGAVCFPGFDYGLSANLNGFFPYPLVNESNQNWDAYVTAHEWGHLHGAPHSHEQQPLNNIDNCGSTGDCSQIPGTIMSYCHQCGIGTAGINLNFHPQNINSWMLAYFDNTGLWEGSGAQCDLTGDPLCNPAPCPPDTNGDGSLTPADFSAWIAAFNAGAPACDQNGDNACTPADFSAWIAAFNAGCP